MTSVFEANACGENDIVVDDEERLSVTVEQCIVDTGGGQGTEIWFT